MLSASIPTKSYPSGTTLSHPICEIVLAPILYEKGLAKGIKTADFTREGQRGEADFPILIPGAYLDYILIADKN
jgi:hypothetical protein